MWEGVGQHVSPPHLPSFLVQETEFVYALSPFSPPPPCSESSSFAGEVVGHNDVPTFLRS